MTTKELTIGLEEELFLVNSESGELCKAWPDALWQACQQSYPDQIVHEFLGGQVEVISSPHQTIDALHQELHDLRQFLVRQAAQSGLAPMACSTHPTAKWHQQKPTVSDRYSRLAEELKISAERMLVCGMHIHIGLPDPKERLKLLNELTYYLPVILSLTSSSPYWAGQDTGLVSYRATIVNGLPRAGLPPVFANTKAYQAYIDHMVNAGAIESAKELWWDLRLSARFPTVELRIADCCTSQQDVIAVAAFVKCLARYLLVNDKSTKSELELRLLCARENRWRAQRYSSAESRFIVTDRDEIQPFSELLTVLIEQLLPHGQALGCQQHLLHCLNICQNGTSADKQRKVFQQAIAQGATKLQALAKVTHHLIHETANPFPAKVKKGDRAKQAEPA